VRNDTGAFVLFGDFRILTGANEGCKVYDHCKLR
jgi:hypothetical protein